MSWQVANLIKRISSLRLQLFLVREWEGRSRTFRSQKNRNVVINVRLCEINVNRNKSRSRIFSFALPVLLVRESLHRLFRRRMVQVLMFDIWFLRSRHSTIEILAVVTQRMSARAVREFNFISRDDVVLTRIITEFLDVRSTAENSHDFLSPNSFAIFLIHERENNSKHFCYVDE